MGCVTAEGVDVLPVVLLCVLQVAGVCCSYGVTDFKHQREATSLASIIRNTMGRPFIYHFGPTD